MIKLVQITREGPSAYRLHNIYLNPKHIIFMSEHAAYKHDLMEGKMNLNIDKKASFTKIKISENSGFSEITVVGDPSTVESKIYKDSKRRLLKS